MKTVTGTFHGEEIEATFTAQMERNDYGVPGSPTWWELDPGSIALQELTLLGVPVELKALPEAAQAAVLALSDEVEFDAN